ncbi:DUF732 domain-containing protein [Mycobacterium sp. 3519A]|uniref:DUF732 domain-containing protein n=1 Tax=Mycobacterium sp. 3519A TaxID=2057184 RepID=UPI00115BBF11|nr:DUF732 domain-containing protein [Mycobacterium sp. 3519A]
MWSKAVRVVIVGAAMSLAFAPSAAADSAGFLHAVVPTYNNVTPQQLLTAGYNACSSIRGGMNSTDAILQVQHEIGVSVPAAGDIVSAAVVHLGC